VACPQAADRPLLNAAGWPARKPTSAQGHRTEEGNACRTEEEETEHGPADYALFLDPGDELVGFQVVGEGLGEGGVFLEGEALFGELSAARTRAFSIDCT